MARLFDEAGTTGTLVVASADGEVIAIHDPDRAATRFSPASTFKIPNTLIALSAGVVVDEASTFEWDGVERDVATWNQDQTLATAFSRSCVWCYQVIARSVGRDTYLQELAAFDYGNRVVGGAVDRFWLDGSLAISATEQIAFLASLLGGELDVPEQHLEVLLNIMAVDETDDYALYAKSGWTGAALHTGWYVGFVDTADGRSLFALNIDMQRAEQAPLRKNLALDALRALDIIP